MADPTLVEAMGLAIMKRGDGRLGLSESFDLARAALSAISEAGWELVRKAEELGQ